MTPEQDVLLLFNNTTPDTAFQVCYYLIIFIYFIFLNFALYLFVFLFLFSLLLFNFHFVDTTDSFVHWQQRVSIDGRAWMGQLCPNVFNNLISMSFILFITIIFYIYFIFIIFKYILLFKL